MKEMGFLKYNETRMIKEIDPETDKEKLVKYGDFLVRETVAKKLDAVQKWLKRKNINYKLSSTNIFNRQSELRRACAKSGREFFCGGEYFSG